MDGAAHMCDRGRGVAARGPVGQGELGPLPGAQHLTLTALPGLEPASVEHGAHRPGARASTSRWAYSTARSSRWRDQLGALLESVEAVLGGAPIRLSSWSRSNSSWASPGASASARSYAAVAASGIVLVVERGEAEVAPDDRVGRVELGRSAPVA